MWRLITQTLILYGIILLPVLWIGRRISRPLRDLTRAAEHFDPREPGAPIPEQGPLDVSALIAAFNALRLRIGAMLEEKDRMLGAIGHDLRTPLAALRVRIESVEDEQDRLRMADTIAEMNKTLEDILSLARVGRPSEAETDVDLNALVDAVVADFHDLGQDVTFEESGRLRLKLRPSLMRRAVRNLIENAVKYGHAADVRIDARANDVAIIVADQVAPASPPINWRRCSIPSSAWKARATATPAGSGWGWHWPARSCAKRAAISASPTGPRAGWPRPSPCPAEPPHASRGTRTMANAASAITPAAMAIAQTRSCGKKRPTTAPITDDTISCGNTIKMLNNPM